MVFFERVDESEVFAQLYGKALRIVLADLQPAAAKRTTDRKGADDGMTTRHKTPLQQVQIMPPIGLLGEKMKHSSIMPYFDRINVFDLRDVGYDPSNQIGFVHLVGFVSHRLRTEPHQAP